MPNEILENERKILIELFKFSKEMSNSEIPKLYELGHYLTDNLFSKVGMLVAKENGLSFQYTTSRGNIRTRPLNWLYDNILRTIYPNIPDYDEIEDLHEKRNFYQHDYNSIESHFNKQFAIDFIEKAERILKDIGYITRPNEKRPTSYLRISPTLDFRPHAYNSIYSDSFQKLYDRMKKKDKINVGIDLNNLIHNVIGRIKFSTVMSMQASRRGDIFQNELWNFFMIRSLSGIQVSVKDVQSEQGYNFLNPEENIHVLEKWLNYFKEQCEENYILIED